MQTTISPAIIMRIVKFGETDLIVGFITPDKGRLKGIAKGARKSRKRFANCLDHFCLANLEYEIKRKGDLHFLHSGKLIEAFPGLRSDFSSLSLASYMIELTEVLFPPGVADKNMFELLKDSFSLLHQGERNDALRIHFEARAMTLGGYRIDFDRCCHCGRPYAGEGKVIFVQEKGGISCLKCGRESRLSPGLEPESAKRLTALQSARWGKGDPLNMTEETIHEIKAVLKLHIEYRLGRRLKTGKYLDV
ncbi:MAG: DNA repair protein RecO [Deltaproteobacteria bacterium]|nr:DNA repair protein RecO [Deltaproteobacteria bacterium]